MTAANPLTRRTEYPMKRLALAAVSAAAIGLTACTHATAPGGAAGAPSPSHDGTAVVPVSCSQQYHRWVHREGEQLMGALGAVSSAARGGHAPARADALKHARSAVARAARHPIPACADPRGYWSALLMHVNAAVGGGDRSSVRAALHDVPRIHHQLIAEVRETAQ